MDLSFRIIWFEDVDEWYDSISRRISRYVSKKNFKIEIERVKNIRDFSLDNYQIQDYDLLIVDYELSKVYEAGNVKSVYGSQIINLVRKGKFVNDILFYSSHGYETINNVMKKEGLQGVFIADRDNGEFMEMAKLLIDKAIRRTENIVNIRGIVMDTTSEFDNKIKDIISISWKLLGNKESKISNNIQKKILKDNSKCASKLCKKYVEINDKNIDELLNERDFSAYRRARLLSWCIDANSDLKEQLRKIMEKYIDIPDSGKKVNFFELYHRDVIIYRNALAHVKNAPEKETSCFVVEIAGDIIVFNRELCDKLRKTLLSYEKILDEMFDYIERNY